VTGLCYARPHRNEETIVDIEIPESFADLSDEQLAELHQQVRQALSELVNAENPTIPQVEEAEALAVQLDRVENEVTSRGAAAAALNSRVGRLRDRFSNTPVRGSNPNDDTNNDEEQEGEPSNDVEEAKPGSAKSVAASTEPQPDPPPEPPPAPEQRRKFSVDIHVPRPEVPTNQPRVAITAAADVPEFATGSDIPDLRGVTKALINRMKNFRPPNGDGMSEDLRHYGVASFRVDYPEDLTIDVADTDRALEILRHAGDESRLPGKSLTASGGWCAPSEVMYGFCSGETLEGILSIPEVNVTRGGIKFTSGPDFSSIYSNVGFCQTEAQAISGTAKTCYEVPCPNFTDIRLDACGLCIKAPILTNAAYPELVQRWVTGGMIAHQHKMNAKVLNAMVTAAGAALAPTDLTSTAQNTLGYLELIADGVRDNYRFGITSTMEVVVPFWVKGAIRSDLAIRMGRDTAAVTDADIAAEFANRHLNVSFVYDWQDLTLGALHYPTTFTALVYPAGTFVKGTADVINLNAVYDAASLVTNIYTALFYEQGILIAQMCYKAFAVTVPVCSSGHTGTANVAACMTS
jgi:hypothetical protein